MTTQTLRFFARVVFVSRLRDPSSPTRSSTRRPLRTNEMFSIAVNASRVAAIPRAGSRAAARPARVAVAARASVGSDGSLVFTSADFDAGTSTSVAVALITLASLAPKLRANPIAPRDGITEDAEAFFVFRSDAERLNGRAAMVGITAWALIEAVTGTAAL